LIRKGYEVSDIIMLDSYFITEVNEQRLTEEQSREYAYQMIDEFLKNYSNLKNQEKVFKDYFSKKIMSYFTYLDFLVTNGCINTDISLLAANVESIKKEVRGNREMWKHATGEKFKMFDGCGSHNEMLLPRYVEENASIIKKILNKEV